jgi:hypothetical protein
MPIDSESVTKALGTINKAWLEGRPQDMGALIHPGITVVFPGFAGRATGRDAFIAGFVDFCQNARIISYHEHDHQVDLIADLAVANFGSNAGSHRLISSIGSICRGFLEATMRRL